MISRVLRGCLLGVSALVNAPAMANTIDFTATSQNSSYGFDLTNGVAVTNSSNVVTSLSGDIVGLGSLAGYSGQITSLLPLPSNPSAAFIYDNVFKTTASYLDIDGIAFNFGPGLEGNLYDENGTYYLYVDSPAGYLPRNTIGSVVGLDVSVPGLSTTPLPSSVWLFGSGLIVLGLIGFARNRQYGPSTMGAAA
jgi:hypothetical protein